MRGRSKPLRRGSVLIEAGLSLLLLAPILAGLIEVGYAFSVYSRLEWSLREAARYASRQPAGSGCVEEARTRIRNLAVYGDQGANAARPPRVPGLRPTHIQVDYVRDEVGQWVEVRLSVSGYDVEALFSRIRLHGRPLAAAPYLAEGRSCGPAGPAGRREPGQ